MNLSRGTRAALGLYFVGCTALCLAFSFVGEPNVAVFFLLMVATVPGSVVALPVTYAATTVIYGPDAEGWGPSLLTFGIWMSVVVIQTAVVTKVCMARRRAR